MLGNYCNVPRWVEGARRGWLIATCCCCRSRRLFVRSARVNPASFVLEDVLEQASFTSCQGGDGSLIVFVW